MRSFRHARLARATAFALGLTTMSTGGGAEDGALLPAAIGVSELFAADVLSGLAMGGYDPVSYWTGEPRIGQRRYELIWGGLAWRFASEANRAAFARDPAVFAPRIGGYDAERIGSRLLVPGDPKLFVVDRRGLYLFRSDESRRRFIEDETASAKAEQDWQEIGPQLVQG